MRGREERVPSIVHEVLRSPGQPLDAAAQAFMEPRLGHDFAAVRVHTDARAAASARAVGARAYTVGRDVVFAEGTYAPGTAEGRRLLAHELTHVAQQGAAPVPTDLAVAPPGMAAEREADVAARRLSGLRGPVREAHPAAVQRQETTEDEEPPTYQLQLQWPGFDPQQESIFGFDYRFGIGTPSLLDFDVEGYMATMLELERMRRALFGIDYAALLTEPPPLLTAPPAEPEVPLVPAGPGPETPRAAEVGDLLGAVLRVPAVDQALTGLKTQAVREAERTWNQLDTAGRVLLITQTALVGGSALTAVLANDETRQLVLDQIQGRTLPIPGVPGLTTQFQFTGPELRLQFGLDVNALLPPQFQF